MLNMLAGYATKKRHFVENCEIKVPGLESMFLTVPESIATSRWMTNWNPSEDSRVTYSLSDICVFVCVVKMWCGEEWCEDVCVKGREWWR